MVPSSPLAESCPAVCGPPRTQHGDPGVSLVPCACARLCVSLLWKKRGSPSRPACVLDPGGRSLCAVHHTALCPRAVCTPVSGSGADGGAMFGQNTPQGACTLAGSVGGSVLKRKPSPVTHSRSATLTLSHTAGWRRWSGSEISLGRECEWGGGVGGRVRQTGSGGPPPGQRTGRRRGSASAPAFLPDADAHGPGRGSVNML